MKLTFAHPDEREYMRRLCDDLATKIGPLYKNAHTILKGALDASGKPTNSPATLSIEDTRAEFGLREASEMVSSIARRLNPNANVKPAFPKGRW